MGNPARSQLAGAAAAPQVARTRPLELPIVTDLRGSLSFGEFGQHLPFQPKRYFVLYDVPTREVRGEHAHKALQQVLVCLKGSCSVAVDDGVRREEHVLDTPGWGLYLGPLVWGTQFHFSPDCILLVLASEAYAADDYIRDYDDFVALAAGGNGPGG